VLVLYVAETLVCFAVFSLVIHWGTAELAGGAGGEFALPALLAACAGVIVGAAGLYQPGNWLRFRRLLPGVGAAAVLLFIIAEVMHAALLVTSADQSHWRGMNALTVGLIGAITLTRVALLFASGRGLLRRRVVLLSAGTAEADPASWIGQDASLHIALSVPAGSDLGAALSPERLRRVRAWAVVAQDSVSLTAPVRATLAAAGVLVLLEPEFRERRLGRIDLARLPGDWAPAGGVHSSSMQAAVRRTFDVVVSLTLLAVTLPLLLVAMAAIRMESPGPVFYRQERVGRGGRVYSILKLRSMVPDAEAGGAARWASRGDPRVTRVGRILRRTRIDEIPQVINVLRGDMALIGPRPERPAFTASLAQVIPHYHARALVKPGITGWAQVNYPYGASVEDARAKLAYDLYYLDRRSLFLDLLILIATVRVVLFQEGSR
jgi:exopolysaccharide biosynthesis polyprenyl glycosylphosphotransferase